MTDQPIDPGPRPDDVAARPTREADTARVRARPRKRHVAQDARIAAAGIGATTMVGLVGVLGYTQPSTASPDADTRVAVVTYGIDATGVLGPASTETSSANTTLTARPIVRPASPTDQTPAASTNGSD